MPSVIQSSIFILLQLTIVTFAWGPLTHYEIGCATIYPTMDTLTCLQNNVGTLQAAALPDAFFFDARLIQNTSCPAALADLHSPIFAGYAVQQALEMNNTQYLEYSLALGSHTIADLAGFETFYLSTDSNVRWLPTWQFMLSLDSYVANEWLSTESISIDQIARAINVISQPISSDEANWIASATSYYASTADPSFTVITAQQALTCSQEWSSSILPVSIQAVQKAQLSSCYQQEISFYDATTRNLTLSDPELAWSEAEQRFNTYESCGINAVGIWKDALVSKGLSPTIALTKALSYVLTC